MAVETGIFSKLREFEEARAAAAADEADRFAGVSDRLSEIDRVAKESLQSWREEPSSLLGKVKNKVRSLFHAIPKGEERDITGLEGIESFFGWLGNRAVSALNGIRSLGDRIDEEAGKESAAHPFDFSAVTPEEREKLEERASLLRAAAKALLIAGAILLFGGVVAPFALGPLLIALPEVVALAVIAGFTLSSVTGVAGVVAASILKDAKPIVECEAKSDEEFRQFVAKFLQTGGEENFNLREEHLGESKLMQVYRSWRESTEEALWDTHPSAEKTA